ncbi:class I SAM-dependent methyltransferase [[Eubacterium] cellulosolvens]
MADTTSSHCVFPSRLSFFLDNPFRRLIEPPKKVLDLLDLSKNDVAVDFGCGTGYYTIPLAKRVQKAIGIDVQSGMLKKAEDNAKKHSLNIKFLKSDGTRIPIPDSTADLILMIRVFHEIEDKIQALKEFERILKKDGKIAIKEKTKGSLLLTGPPIIKTSDIIRQLEDAGLKVIDQNEIGCETLIISKLSR